MSLHAERLGSQLHRVLQGVLDHELSDPRLESRITITEVKVHSSGNTAVISVVVSPENKERLTLKALDSATAHIRRRVGTHLPDARLPVFQFRLDRGARRQASALDAIARAEAERRELEQSPQHQPESSDETESPS